MAIQTVKFIKYSGTGNDFILIDNRKNVLSGINVKKFTRMACPPKSAIGADGVVLLETSKIADFKMRIINADGSEPEMCGNGSRCIVHFANLIKQNNEKNVEFETIAGIISGELKKNDTVKVGLTEPFGLKREIQLKYMSKKIKAGFLNTGVPHTVVFVKKIEKVDVFNMGRYLRNHKCFKPAGTNVNFVEVVNSKKIKVRTYERGVENETLACGTGSTASAILSSLLFKLTSPVSVITSGGEQLRISFNIIDSSHIKDVYLEGKVTPVYTGAIGFNGNSLVAAKRLL